MSSIIGVLRFNGTTLDEPSDSFENRLQSLIRDRITLGMDAVEEVRKAVRDMLRNGKFRPTGRSKPASEYLLRCVLGPDAPGFPRISPVVDVANYVSLRYALPVSLWDRDRAAEHNIQFRLGRNGESYVFNQSGQSIDLRDLVVGCAADRCLDRLEPDVRSRPIVNPVKDSQETKVTAETNRFGACVYAPAGFLSVDEVAGVGVEFAHTLALVMDLTDIARTVLSPGDVSQL